MFNKVSVTGVGMLVFMLSTLLGVFDIAIDTETLTGFVNALIQVVGFVLMLYGQLSRKDLIVGIVRK